MHHFEVRNDTGVSADGHGILYQDKLEQQSYDLALQRFYLGESIGSSILGHVKLIFPDNDEVKRMLYNICEESCNDPSTNPLSVIDPEYFNMSVLLFGWQMCFYAVQ